jgi:bifunctional non-homologous end joining protein LigD
MTEWRDRLSAQEQECIAQRAHPDWTAPMLATLTEERFRDPDWIFERKLDGERALCFRDGDRIRLLTRNRKDIGETYPEIVDALAGQDSRDFVVDGEIVAFENGRTSFARLQQRMGIRDAQEAHGSGVAVYFYLFDILHLDGYGLDDLPLRARKGLLRQVLRFEDPLRYTPHRNGEGEAFFDDACSRGWEGLIAKNAASGYRHSRSRDWLKFKCDRRQELVIGGFTAPKGTRKGFGALLVGYYEGDSLRYAGKVGTGFNEAFLTDFRRRLEAMTRKTTPFDEPVDETDVTFVTPDIVGEFGFTEWTQDGKLRHPRFLGLRRDKEAGDVVRETPEAS